jgi:hypothetical protein
MHPFAAITICASVILVISSTSVVAEQPAPIPFEEEKYTNPQSPLVIRPSKPPTRSEDGREIFTLGIDEERPSSGPFVTVESIQRENAVVFSNC